MTSTDDALIPPARVWAAFAGSSCKDMANSTTETKKSSGMSDRSRRRITGPTTSLP